MFKKNITRILTIVLFIHGNLHLQAQEPMSLYFLETIPQSNMLNPAMTPRCNGYFGVPGVNAIYMNLNSDLAQKAFLQNTDSGAVTLTSKHFDFNKMNRILGKGLSIRNYDLITPLSLGFRGEKGYFSFAISEKIKLNAIFPTDFLNIMDKGLFDGAEFDFSRLGVDAQIYQELSFGYARDFTSKLKAGARVKLLQGLFSVKTDFKEFTLNTGEEEWNFNLDGTIYTSAPLNFHTNESGFIDSLEIDPDIEGNLTNFIKENILGFSNRGIAADIGAVYNLDQNWSFSASIIDLGFIRWKNNVSSIHFEGNHAYTGFDMDGIDSLDVIMDELLDSINFVDAKLGHDKYSTGLGTTLYLGAEFNVNHYLSLGVLSRSIFDKDYFYQEFNFSSNFNLYHFLTANLNYNFSFTGESYAGLGLGLNFAPLQFYLVLDRIPLTYTNYVIDGERILGPYNMRSFNIMLGLNFVFGAKGFVDKPKIDTYSEF